MRVFVRPRLAPDWACDVGFPTVANLMATQAPVKLQFKSSLGTNYEARAAGPVIHARWSRYKFKNNLI